LQSLALAGRVDMRLEPMTVLVFVYISVISSVGAFLFVAVDRLEPNRRLALVFKCAILAAGAAVIANHLP
jgi:hypothetical protein